MRVLVTGAAGQLGRAIVEEFRRRHEVIATTFSDLDICDGRAVRDRVRAVRPGAVINCAAYTDVDGSEEHPVEALQVNAFALRGLADAAAEASAVLVHYSTDFVFDGRATRPYTEEDPPNPRSTYACSKLLGEWFAAFAPRHYVLRVESLFGARRTAGDTRRTSIDRIADEILAGHPVRVFVDRTVSPSYLPDVCRSTRALVEAERPFGLYHCVNSGTCTWPELAQILARQLGVEARLLPVAMADAGLRAERPVYCAMSNAKLASAGILMRSWDRAVSAFVAELLGRAGPREGPRGSEGSCGS
jgi:dTDP-4-dehydrorhamnose reductase